MTCTPSVRAVLEARLATARIKFSVDVNVGDPVVPAPIRTAVPVLLGDERIDVLAYPKPMVVAEKLVTALQRGRVVAQDLAMRRLQFRDRELRQFHLRDARLRARSDRRLRDRVLLAGLKRPGDASQCDPSATPG